MSLQKYCIKLTVGDGYFCHNNTNRVIIYDADDPNLNMDLHATKGELVKVAGNVLQDVYVRGWYDNQLKEIEDPVESLWDYAQSNRVKDEQTVYLYSPRE